MWSNHLKDREVNYTRSVIDKLNIIPWARPIINSFNDGGGYISENMPIMFELRFAYELYKAGFSAQYEHNTNQGNSTIDFKIETKNINWLIELVSIRTSNAAKRAIKKVGENEYQQILSSEQLDKQTEEDEMITAIQKIGEKVYQKNKGVIKFPLTQPNIYQMIFVDARGYLDNGGDRYDYMQMSWGKNGIPPECIHYSRTKEGTMEYIKGIFEESCPINSSKYVRERIHYLGFVCEDKFTASEIKESAFYFYNHKLLSAEDAKIAFESFPLKKKNV